MIDRNSTLWRYLSDPQKELIKQGEFLLADIEAHPNTNLTDYSYAVFPFAKAYEGFLKQLFLDLHFIDRKEYESDHFRIGKVLSPHLARRLGNRSMYARLVQQVGYKDLAEFIWAVWKRGRNRVFHYFPHNLHALSLLEAREVIHEVIAAMEQAVVQTKVVNG